MSSVADELSKRNFSVQVSTLTRHETTVDVIATSQAEAERMAIELVSAGTQIPMVKLSEELLLSKDVDMQAPEILERLQDRLKAYTKDHGTLQRIRTRLAQIQSNICLEHSDEERAITRGVCMVCAAKALNKSLKQAAEEQDKQHEP